MKANATSEDRAKPIVVSGKYHRELKRMAAAEKRTLRVITERLLQDGLEQVQKGQEAQS